MANAQAFRIQRLTLGAGVFTPIKPPAVFAAVAIGNGTADDLQVHTNEDQTEYLNIAPDFERSVPVTKTEQPLIAAVKKIPGPASSGMFILMMRLENHGRKYIISPRVVLSM